MQITFDVPDDIAQVLSSRPNVTQRERKGRQDRLLPIIVERS